MITEPRTPANPSRCKAAVSNAVILGSFVCLFTCFLYKASCVEDVRCIWCADSNACQQATVDAMCADDVALESADECDAALMSLLRNEAPPGFASLLLADTNVAGLPLWATIVVALGAVLLVVAIVVVAVRVGLARSNRKSDLASFRLPVGMSMLLR
jgi:hypothetical protein